MSCRPAICSHSLGRAWVHDLPSKLDQAAKYGFDIELFYEDLYYIAKELPGGPSHETHLAAAHIIRSLCDERGISIVCLQPFMHYEGLKDRRKHVQRFHEMKLWIQMAKVLDTHIISIPSTCLSEDEVSGDLELITRDLREVADLAAPEGIEFAYESLAWGTHSDTWEQAWEIVRAVDRANFGICLDTFNMAGRVFADPANPSQMTPDAGNDMKASLKRLVQTVDVRKIVYVQVVDAERLLEPLVPGHPFYDPDQPARMSWSRNCRLFYGEDALGAYLPIKDILKAILIDLGFTGWVSAEMFNRSLTDADPLVPAQHARRAAVSWQKMMTDLGLKQDSSLERVIEPAPRAQL